MKKKMYPVIMLAAFSTSLFSFYHFEAKWKIIHQQSFDLYYTGSDDAYAKDYIDCISAGAKTTKTFFGNDFNERFDVFVHPNRTSLDSTWQKDWAAPAFKSECWMVASGIAHKLDLLSPQVWKKQACEHEYSDRAKTQQLITHELVHVFHGQRNISKDFSDIDGLDWFVEGLATFASGQCDSARLAQVKKSLAEGKTPTSLDLFWTGKLKYGLSGSMVMYIDKRYGRSNLIELLPLNRKTDLLSALGCTELQLLSDWQDFVKKM